MESLGCVEVVAARYPHDAEIIMRLYEQSSTFREVCADYCTVISSLPEVGGRPTSEAGDEEALQTLLADLEGEIEQYLHPITEPVPASEPCGTEGPASPIPSHPDD